VALHIVSALKQELVALLTHDQPMQAQATGLQDDAYQPKRAHQQHAEQGYDLCVSLNTVANLVAKP
jgi:hypothetical protein